MATTTAIDTTPFEAWASAAEEVRAFLEQDAAERVTAEKPTSYTGLADAVWDMLASGTCTAFHYVVDGETQGFYLRNKADGAIPVFYTRVGFLGRNFWRTVIAHAVETSPPADNTVVFAAVPGVNDWLRAFVTGFVSDKLAEEPGNTLRAVFRE